MAMIIKKKPAASSLAQQETAQAPAAPETTSAPTAPIAKAGMTKLKITPKADPDETANDTALDTKAVNPVPTSPSPTTTPGTVSMHSGEQHSSKIYKSGAEVTTQQPTPSVMIAGTPALVHVEIGLTRNLGNYESVKISVGITLPCEAEASAIDDTYAEAKGWVDSRVEQINEEITEELKG